MVSFNIFYYASPGPILGKNYKRARAHVGFWCFDDEVLSHT